MRQAMVIAKSDQWTQLQSQICRLRPASNPIFHHRCVLPLNHEHCLFDFDPVHLKRERRKWIEAELFEQAKALWVHNTWITICTELKVAIADNKGFFEL